LSNDANRPAAPACWVLLGLFSLLNAILLDGNGGVYSGVYSGGYSGEV